MIVHYDCRHFLGTKPCAFRRECDHCSHYRPYGKRILIIKLAALGDVLRTTPLLRAFKETDPECHITWLTLPEVLPMLRGIPEIDRLLSYDLETVLRLEVERFDSLYCFDKEPKATALAMKVHAGSKSGFGLTGYGNVMPLDHNSEYTFHLGINDHLKFKVNTKTYPELVFECAGIVWTGPREYVFPDFKPETEAAGKRLEKLGAGPGDLKIGLNTGAGHIFATKKWTETGYSKLADQLIENFGAKVLLLGGPAEADRNLRIATGANYPLIQTGTDNTIRDFAGIVANCDLMVTGDTLAMHIAIGLMVPVVVILGSTCHQEIELYGRGAKIVSDFECSPCYLSACPKEFTCMQAIEANQVFDAVTQVLKQTTETRRHREE
jgi:ADP-heptose:LPS heptosyltransferase